MKCKYCDGTGKSKYGYNQPCTHCDGKGFVEPLTNEEWRRTCSAEEFAKWLTEVTDYCFECGLNINNGVLCPFGKCIDKECDALDWLKEKHHE